MAGLAWLESFLIGAILAPTDPGFASALVGNAKVPGRLRHLLNVESGVNDGLALPWLAIRLEGLRVSSASVAYVPLNGFAIGLLVYAVTTAMHGDLFSRPSRRASRWPPADSLSESPSSSSVS